LQPGHFFSFHSQESDNTRKRKSECCMRVRRDSQKTKIRMGPSSLREAIILQQKKVFEANSKLYSASVKMFQNTYLLYHK